MNWCEKQLKDKSVQKTNKGRALLVVLDYLLT